MIHQAIRAKNVDRNTKKKQNKTKRPPKSSTNKMFVFGLHSTSDDWQGDPSKKCWPKCIKNKKGHLSHRKIKCSFLDYIQLLMIGQTISAKKNELKHKKTKKVIKKLNVHFLDYIQLLIISQAIQAKNVDRNVKNKKGPLSHWKIKCSFLDYAQFLMIGQTISAKNNNWNTKKQKRPPKWSKY